MIGAGRSGGGIFDMNEFDFDVIVIGSGFGGSVMTCRLAEKGYRVCLLERGREYNQNEFPRRINELRKSFWDPKDNLYGSYEMLTHQDSDIITLTSSGLGGGSLFYSNVLLRMHADYFHQWPGGLSREVLDPFYDKVLETMEASPYPYNDPYYKDTPKSSALMNAVGELETDEDAIRAPVGEFPPLALWFKGTFAGEQSRNSHGRLQSRCKKCGECNIGCNIHAKNTLDLNYLSRAREESQLPPGGVAAEIRTKAMVVDILPLNSGGYKVGYLDLNESGTGQGGTKELRAKKVVLSCGSIGSTGLLLKMEKKGSLPNLSSQLGEKWSGNGDLEATILNTEKDLSPTKGPVITYSIDYRYKPYPNGFPHGILIQDGGFPSFLAWYIAGKMPSPRSFVNSLRFAWKFVTRIFRKNPEVNVGDDLAKMVDSDAFLRHSLMLLGMGRDCADGKIVLSDAGDVVVKWQTDSSKMHIDRQIREMKRLAKAMDGTLLVNPITYLDKLIAVHPIGGCPMGDSPETGVVDSGGEVFGYPGLYVVDGSILPTAVGPNPSLTIAAMAERIADKFTINNH